MTTIEIKAAVRTRDGHRCVECGMTSDQHRERYGRDLDVHRTTPGSYYSVDGCVTVCRPCHGTMPRRQPGQPDLENPGVIYARIDPDLGEALDRYIKETEPRSFKQAVVELAVREFLERRGYLKPRKPPPAAENQT